jgi:hypothetical protein
MLLALTSYRDTASLSGPAQLSATQAKAALKKTGLAPSDDLQINSYVDSIYGTAPKFNLNPDLLLGQAILETDYFTSSWWKQRRNPAGIGITGTTIQDLASQTFANGHEGALGHIAHMLAYVDYPRAESLWDAAGLGVPIRTADQRFDAPREADYTAQTLRGLGQVRKNAQGQWLGWSLDDPTYGQKIAERINVVLSKATTSSTPTVPAEETQPVFGRAQHPPVVRSIANKSGGSGFDVVPPRKIVGACTHEWMGAMNADQVKRFFSCPGGERCGNALVDYTVMKDGTLIMLNDPRGTRSPWASGGGVGSPGGLEGDGPAFVSRFGVNQINAGLVSVEVMKQDGEAYTDAQIDKLGQLYAYWHDQDGQLWSEHPYTTKYGLVTSFLHYEFGTTSCGKGELDDLSRVQAKTKGYMKAAQLGGNPAPVPPEVPDLPPPTIPGGLTLAEATARFGTVTKHLPDGATTTGGFDPNGIISLAWAQRSAQEQTWPKIEDWYVLDDSGDPLDVVTFSNNWRLMRVAERAGFQWYKAGE